MSRSEDNPEESGVEGPEVKPPIGWEDKPLREMLNESNELIEQTGYYQGLEDLSLKEEDPLWFEKTFSRLRGGIVNARETALNISASAVVRELGELCFALYTPEGDAIVLSTGIMAHVHTMSDAIKWMIEEDYEEDPGIEPGDIFTNNDAQIGDAHTADVQTIVPVFYDDELIAWAAGVTHVIDIGGTDPGSSPVASTSRFDDGVYYPAQKAGTDDSFDKDYLVSVERATRMPDMWKLDERTRLSGCHLIRQAVKEIVGDIGLDTYKQFIREAIEDGRRSFQSTVQERMVPGRYRGASFFDLPFEGEEYLPPRGAQDFMMHTPIELNVEKDGTLDLDFDGASKWVHAAFNGSPSALQAGLWVFVTQTLNYHERVNDGAYLATEMSYPDGSWINPETHVAATTNSWHFIIPSYPTMARHLSRGYYGRGFVEEIMTGYGGTWDGLQGGGTDHHGNEFSMYNFEIASATLGARGIRDGIDHGYAVWNPEGDMGDMEDWELTEPLLYMGRNVKASSAGAGKYRGGSGFESLRMTWKTNDLHLYTKGDGKVFASAGLFGGYPPNSGAYTAAHDTNIPELVEEQEPLPHKEGDPDDSEIESRLEADFDLQDVSNYLRNGFEEYDIYRNYIRGGPGMGDPIDRDPDMVREDLEEGYELPRFAEDVYGVVAEHNEEDDTWHIDEEATEERRKEIREERLERAQPARDWVEQRREDVVQGKLKDTVKETYNQSIELSAGWGDRFLDFWDLDEDFRFDTEE